MLLQDAPQRSDGGPPASHLLRSGATVALLHFDSAGSDMTNFLEKEQSPDSLVGDATAGHSILQRGAQVGMPKLLFRCSAYSIAAVLHKRALCILVFQLAW